ncbi:MFS transporter [Campylobacter ureolyticus]|uniref:MFS transporter n=1 Tax=Campylobacter ureolyticus TaxID=827 RepID=UPI0022B5A239|nr:MFS transporter [Campylobacter ureolyticus]MCZ6168835.1 MFS transporter [Campylobacter ureolyticus]
MDKKVSKFISFTILTLSLTTIMAGAAIAPALGMISEHFNQTSKILVSQIVSIHSIFIIFSAFLFSFLTKYLNAKNIAILGLCLYIIGGVGASFFDNIWIILFLRAILGIGVGFIQPLTNGLIGFLYNDKDKVKLLGLSSAMSSLMGLIAAPLSAYLAAISWNYSFYIYFLGVFVMVFAVLFLPTVMLRQNKNKTTNLEVLKQIYPFCIAVFLAMLTFYSFPTNFSINILEKDFVEPKYIGLLMGLQHFFVILVGVFFTRILKIFKKYSKFIFGAFFGAGFLMQFLASNLNFVFLGLLLVGLGHGFLMPFIMSRVSIYVKKENMAIAMSLMSIFLYLGQFVNPYLIKFILILFSSNSSNLAFLMSFIFSIILFLWFFYIDRFYFKK